MPTYREHLTEIHARTVALHRRLRFSPKHVAIRIARQHWADAPTSYRSGRPGLRHHLALGAVKAAKAMPIHAEPVERGGAMWIEMGSDFRLVPFCSVAKLGAEWTGYYR